MAEKELAEMAEGAEKAQQCKTCLYYASSGGKQGRCRKYPPRVTSVPKLLVHKGTADEYTTVPKTEWPIVEQSDWCGEFTRRA